MAELEFTGTDIDKALENASKELNLTTDNMEFEIVSLGSKGLFGVIGKRPARIKVFVKEAKKQHIGGKRKTSGKKQPQAAPAKAKHKKEVRRPYSKAIDLPMDEKLSDEVKSIESFVTRIIGYLDENAKVKAYLKKGKIIVTVKSKSSGKIIGKGGYLINSIEYLTIKHARKIYNEKVRVVLHIEGSRNSPNP